MVELSAGQNSAADLLVAITCSLSCLPALARSAFLYGRFPPVETSGDPLVLLLFSKDRTTPWKNRNHLKGGVSPP